MVPVGDPEYQGAGGLGCYSEGPVQREEGTEVIERPPVQVHQVVNGVCKKRLLDVIPGRWPLGLCRGRGLELTLLGGPA